MAHMMMACLTEVSQQCRSFGVYTHSLQVKTLYMHRLPEVLSRGRKRQEKKL